jgi:hypothetical protein
MPGPYSATSTTDDVLDGVDLSGKRILVSGSKPPVHWPPTAPR